MDKMKALILDTKAESELDAVVVKEIEKDLDTYYQVIGCDIIDITTRKIGGKYFDIVTDDESLYKSDPIISVVDEKLSPMIVGSVIVCNSADGELTSLSDEDIELIKGEIISLIDMAHGKISPVIKASIN